LHACINMYICIYIYCKAGSTHLTSGFSDILIFHSRFLPAFVYVCMYT
jgi:hypothetical protein